MGEGIISKIGLVGFDGNPVFDFFDAPISYIQQPIDVLVQNCLLYTSAVEYDTQSGTAHCSTYQTSHEVLSFTQQLGRDTIGTIHQQLEKP